MQVLGDCRWTASLIQETWRVAQTGCPPEEQGEGQIGGSHGGFDLLRFVEDTGSSPLSPDQVDLSIPLNRRKEGARIAIPFPIYGGGMSYGSISLAVMKGRAMAAQALGTFISTGEGGYPDDLKPYADHVITQIATGLFGVREETIQRARLIEFKYAQGAKPGLGGHLLGEKNTPDVATCARQLPGRVCSRHFPFTVFTPLKITKNIWIGSGQSIRRF